MEKISPSSHTTLNQSSTPLKKFGESILQFITQDNQSPLVRTGQLVMLGGKILATQRHLRDENRAINLEDIFEITQVASTAWLTPIFANKAPIVFVGIFYLLLASFK